MLGRETFPVLVRAPDRPFRPASHPAALAYRPHRPSRRAALRGRGERGATCRNINSAAR